MIRRTLRLFFRPSILAMFAIAVAWAVWWILPERPLRIVHANWTLPNLPSWIEDPPAGQERSIHSSLDEAGPILEIDLRADKLKEIVNTSRKTTQLIAPLLSWAAWALDDGAVHVAHLPGGQQQFTIPAIGSSSDAKHLIETRPLLTASKDDRFLAIAAPRPLIAEIWDVPAQILQLRIAGITGSVEFSPDGKRIAAFTDANGIGVWEIQTGEKVATLPTKGWSAGRIGFTPAGGLLVGELQTDAPRITNTLGLPKKAWPLILTLWSPDYHRVDAEFQSASNYTTYGRTPYCFTADGRFVEVIDDAMHNQIWDLTERPPRCIDAEVDVAPGLSGRIELRNHHLIVHDIRRKSECLRYYDLRSLTAKPLEDADTLGSAHFSPSGRLIVASERSPATPKWKLILQQWLPRSWFDFLEQERRLVILDAETGRIRNRVPGNFLVAWPADENAVWTWKMDASMTAGQQVYALYPTIASPPPWYLWPLTIAAAAVIIYDIRRTWKRRAQPAAA